MVNQSGKFNFRLSNEDVECMKILEEKTGLSRSEIVRRLIRSATIEVAPVSAPQLLVRKNALAEK